MDLGAGRHRRDETQLVGAVVDYVAIADDLISRFDFERRYQAEREKAVRDGSAERALTLRALDIDMDPLMIAGNIGELVDLVLCHLDRLAPAAVFGADLRFQLFDVVKTNGFHFGLLKN